MPRTVVVLPTYNEAENLPLIVPAILAQAEEIEVLVVDDASPDGTGKLANHRDGLAPRHGDAAGGAPRGHLVAVRAAR